MEKQDIEIETMEERYKGNFPIPPSYSCNKAKRASLSMSSKEKVQVLANVKDFIKMKVIFKKQLKDGLFL